MHKFGKAIAQASDRHRILAALFMAVVWAGLEYGLQWHNASKAAEIFALSPFADRALGVFLGE